VGEQQKKKLVEQLRKKIQERLRSVIIQNTAPQDVTITVENGRLSLRLSATRFFDAAQASLRPDALPVLDAIADELVPLDRPLRIEGHTDDTRLGNSRLRSNWELSAARAASVVEYFQDVHHAKPELLTAAGRASSMPIAPNDTPEHRELNRRIEITLELPPGDMLSALVK